MTRPSQAVGDLTASSADLTVLLARVEAAEGPAPELDALIMCALRAPAGAYVEQSKINGAWCIYTAPNRIWSPSTRDGTWRREGWPLTESLDAALALCERVLPGCRYRLEKDAPATERRFWATCGMPGEQEHAEGHTTSLALLAALLRALIASASTVEEG